MYPVGIGPVLAQDLWWMLSRPDHCLSARNRNVRDVIVKEMQSLLLTTVNAPYRTRMDGRQLAAALSAGDVSLGQVNSFFMETTVKDQKAFAKLHGVPECVLVATAESFANWSGQKPALLA